MIDKKIYREADSMELTLHPSLLQKIRTCGDGLSVQVLLDMDTGEIWGDLQIGNDWNDYHDDAVVTIGWWDAARAEALVEPRESDDWDDDEQYDRWLAEELECLIKKQARYAAYCTRVERVELERGNRDHADRVWGEVEPDDFCGLTPWYEECRQRGVTVL